MKTVKDLSIELGVSKVRIQQVIDKLPLNKKPSKINNKYFLNEDECTLIKGYIKKGSKKSNADDKENLSITFWKVIDNQNEQLKEKDKQIENLQRLLDQQQQLQLLLTQEKQQLQLELKKNKNKKSLFEWLKRKED